MAAWERFVRRTGPPFTIPGHKRRAGEVSAVLGRILDADVPLHGGLDTIGLDAGTLTTAEALAAQLWGADWCRFSTGGSTHANQAVALAVGRPGDTVLVTRTAHRSTLLGLVLAGLRPVWLPVRLDPRFGVPLGTSAQDLGRALDAHPEAVGLLLVEPSYVGTRSADLAEAVRMAHAHGLRVVVDQAWGAHFGFAPGYPDHALALGADAVVMSAHKTLPAFSQAAYVLARTERFDRGWLDRCFEASATTSPAGAVLASADASRAVLAHPAGAALLERTAALVAGARERLRGAGFVVPGPEDFPAGAFDPAKLVVQVGGTGADGLALEAALRAAGMPVEMADRATVLPLVSLLDDAGTLDALVSVLVAHRTAVPPGARPAAPAGAGAWAAMAWQPPVAALTPREAFFARDEVVPRDRVVGRVSAETIAPYPPGVPVLVPGEVVEEAQLAALDDAAGRGTRIAYAADPSLATFRVVA